MKGMLLNAKENRMTLLMVYMNDQGVITERFITVKDFKHIATGENKFAPLKETISFPSDQSDKEEWGLKMDFDDIRFKDRGVKKWTSLMLPEHVEMLQNFANEEYYKSPKPLLDPYQIQEFESKIHYAMEFHYPVIFKVWYGGFTEEVRGFVHYLDPINKEIRLKDDEGNVERIKFKSIIGVEVEDI